MTISRRDLIAGLGASSTVAAAIVSPVLAKPGTDALAALIDETADASLIRLGNELAEAIQRRAYLKAVRAAARRGYDAAAPATPSELIHANEKPGYRAVCRTPARDIEQSIIEGHELGADPQHETVSVKSLRWVIQPGNYGRRTKEGKFALALLPIAEAHEAAVAAAVEQTGLRGAIEQHRAAIKEADRIAREIHEAPAVTMAGLVVKARAILAEPIGGAIIGAEKIAASILAITEV